MCLSETALKLDTLVGDIEDAVSYTMSKHLRMHSSNQNSEVSKLSIYGPDDNWQLYHHYIP